MQWWIFSGQEISLVIKLLGSLLAGVLIGLEREYRGKSAGISTYSMVIGGAMIFTALSIHADPNSPARIAAQIVSGVGFLGAGMILVGQGEKVKNLTTAAGLWFAAAIGMSIGFDWYLLAGVATLYCIVVPRIPHAKQAENKAPTAEIIK
ncbi:MAG TPA: MgtC/SapB family protein [Candidatus Nanoarchaeia archaeon]|nr:MgtC/SapB family protein [Candidatus Nanoarchaeia archaeon]